ncbi:MAG: TlpA family protein disulfide reductase [Deltaproteobacteria bacterium]|nr:TlpA family protein disulfide reductase [Deltaproteobacteria bacterium]
MRFLTLLCLTFSSLSVAKIAPNFQGELMGGGRVNLVDELVKDHSKAILLCFWATWCAPCIQELKQVTERLRNDPTIPLKLLTINVDTAETASDVSPTLKLYDFKIPVIKDQKHEIFSKFQDAKTLPFSVLIKPNGEIAETFNGFHEAMVTKVREALK